MRDFDPYGLSESLQGIQNSEPVAVLLNAYRLLDLVLVLYVLLSTLVTVASPAICSGLLTRRAIDDISPAYMNFGDPHLSPSYPPHLGQTRDHMQSDQPLFHGCRSRRMSSRFVPPLMSLDMDRLPFTYRSRNASFFIFMLIIFATAVGDIVLTCCSLSEEFTDCYSSGSFLFNHPSVVAHWNQSVPFGEFSLPTPPDTSSECTPSEYQDMSSQAWSQPSLPEEWMSLPAPDHSALMQPSRDDGNTHGIPVTTREIQALDNASWLSAPHGSVDSGLSPVLSHESQSSHTLNSFSEPDTCVLPPGLDLSFTAEPSWNPSGPDVYTSSDATAPGQTAYGCPPSYGHEDYSMACSTATSHGLYPGSDPLFFPQGGQAAYQRRLVPYPSAPPMRTLLPRTESLTMSTQPAYGSQRTLRPHVHGSRSMQSVTSSVSSSSGQPPNGAQTAVSPAQASGYPLALPRSAPNLAHALSDPAKGVPSAQSGFVSHNRPVVSVPFMSDPTAEDFSAFIHFDHEEHNASPGDLRSEDMMRHARDCDTDVADSYIPGHGILPDVQVDVSESVKPVLSKLEQDVKSNYPGSSNVSASLTSESDEGRYRTDPLYSRGPSADGLYYCPFEDDKEASCKHQPTKLKCNYEYG